MIGDIFIMTSGTVAAVRLVPQIIKTLKTKSVDDFSLIWIGLIAVCAILFPLGCFLNGNMVCALSYTTPSILHLIFTYMCLKYRRKNSK